MPEQQPDKPYIFFQNSQRKIKIGGELKSLLEQCVAATLAAEGFFLPCEVDITFVSDEKIRALNREHRGIDRSTDVLSFPLYEKEEIDDLKKSAPAEEILLGDIVLSLETAKRQSEEYGHSFEREAGYLSVHSALHLLGYDHESEAEREIMREKEESILQGCALER